MSTPTLETLMPTHAIIRDPQFHTCYRCLCGASGDLATVRLHVVEHNLTNRRYQQ